MAAPTESAVSPLPDFDLVADSLNTASLQLRRCTNLPAVAGVQDVIAAIQQLGTQVNARIDALETGFNARIDALETGLNARIDALETNLNTLGIRQRASDANNIVRLQNARSVSAIYRQLEPLYSMRTGDIIANFPVSLDDLDRLWGNEAEAILRELDNAIPVSVEQKRRRIRLLCGVSIR
ncbi:hypothetical protein P885DRAFT_75980 [Corynascus similis CBS 632.67]